MLDTLKQSKLTQLDWLSPRTDIKAIFILKRVGIGRYPVKAIENRMEIYLIISCVISNSLSLRKR